jgi:competence protein ComFC
MLEKEKELSTPSMEYFLKLKNIFLDILFPIYCLVCQKYGSVFCDECLGKIKYIEEQVCPYCEKIATPKGSTCSRCKEKIQEKNFSDYLNFLIAATRYKENQLGKIIHNYKYNFIRDLSLPLGSILVSALLRNEIAIPDIIVPVPLHKRRLRWRGFNQAELLSFFISRNLTPGLEIPMEISLILRKKFTPPQMEIKRYKERKVNLQNAFSANPASDISGKYILLVDDVATTGATLFECAKVLKQSGAKKVGAIVLARQEIGKKR